MDSSVIKNMPCYEYIQKQYAACEIECLLSLKKGVRTMIEFVNYNPGGVCFFNRDGHGE